MPRSVARSGLFYNLPSFHFASVLITDRKLRIGRLVNAGGVFGYLGFQRTPRITEKAVRIAADPNKTMHISGIFSSYRGKTCRWLAG